MIDFDVARMSPSGQSTISFYASEVLENNAAFVVKMLSSTLPGSSGGYLDAPGGKPLVRVSASAHYSYEQFGMNYDFLEEFALRENINNLNKRR